MNDEEHDRSLAEVLSALDAEPGPMQPLTAAEAHTLTARVVARWSNALAGVEPADSEPGPAAPLTAADAQRLVFKVTEQHARVQSPRTLVRTVAAAAVVVLSVSGVAFGALRVWGPSSIGSAGVTRSAAHAPAKSQRVAAKATPDLAPQAETPAPPVLATQPPTPTPTPTPTPAPAPALEPARALPLTAAAIEPAPTLARANTLRAARDWRGAQRVYLRVADVSVRPAERYVAEVAAAALCLQHTADARRAIALYQRALHDVPQGDLSEEIRLGIAHAWGVLDQPDAELSALEEFLTYHGDSLAAPEARARLAALRTPPL